ncbi:MAG: MAPEG family protein [Pseudomonadota bacterium]
MISEHPDLFLAITLWLVWVFGLYGFVSVLRILMLGGKSGLAAIEARAAANLSNQFEAPLVLLAAIVLLLMEGAVTPFVTNAVWVFLAGRILHSLVHVGQARIVPRGLVFTINFSAIVAVWGALAVHVFGAAP